VRLVCPGGLRYSLLQKLSPLHAVRLWPTPRRRKRHPETVLREAVYGRQRFTPEAVRGKASCEALERLEVDGLGTVERDAPARKVETLKVDVVKLGRAEVVGEVWGGRQRALPGGNRA
jgi:hypothetical protein